MFRVEGLGLRVGGAVVWMTYWLNNSYTGLTDQQVSGSKNVGCGCLRCPLASGCRMC